MRFAWLLVLVPVVLGGCDRGPKWSETESGTIRTVTNRGGRTLGYVTTSGVKLLIADRSHSIDEPPWCVGILQVQDVHDHVEHLPENL